jgi:hypothetical protein
MIQVVLEATELTAGQSNELTIWLINTSRETVTNLVCRLDLPANITLLKGFPKIEVSQISAGQRLNCNLQVSPNSTGTWILTSSNFSYRDSSGKSHRIKDLRCEINVVEALPPPPEANIKIKLRSKVFYLNEWEKLQGEISNVGSVDLRKLLVKVVGQVKCDTDVYLGVLLRGKQVDFSVLICALESGNYVPASVEITYTDVIGRTSFRRISAPLQVKEKVKSGDTFVESQFIGGTFGIGNMSGGEIKEGAKVAGVINESEHQNLAAAAAEIQQLLQQLSQTYSTATTSEQMIVAAEAIKQIEGDPNWKKRVINAAKEGGLATFEKVLDNPVGALITGAIKGWLEMKNE